MTDVCIVIGFHDVHRAKNMLILEIRLFVVIRQMHMRVSLGAWIQYSRVSQKPIDQIRVECDFTLCRYFGKKTVDSQVMIDLLQ